MHEPTGTDNENSPRSPVNAETMSALAARWAVADATRRTDPARAEASKSAQVRAAGHTHAGHADADARADGAAGRGMHART